MKYAGFTNLFLEFFEKNFFGINSTYHCINIKFQKVKNKNPFKINSIIKKLVERNKLYVRRIKSDNEFEFGNMGF